MQAKLSTLHNHNSDFWDGVKWSAIKIVQYLMYIFTEIKHVDNKRNGVPIYIFDRLYSLLLTPG